MGFINLPCDTTLLLCVTLFIGCVITSVDVFGQIATINIFCVMLHKCEILITWCIDEHCYFRRCQYIVLISTYIAIQYSILVQYVLRFPLNREQLKPCLTLVCVHCVKC